MRERRVAGSEIVQRESDSELSECCQHVSDSLGVREDGTLSHLEDQRVRRQSAASELIGDLAREVHVDEIGDGRVDGQVEIVPGRTPDRKLVECDR